MGPYRVSGCLKVAFLALVLTLLPVLAMGGGDRGDTPEKPDPVPWTGPVPKAHCGPNDRPETGLQGQTTLAERVSGLSEKGFTCNRGSTQQNIFRSKVNQPVHGAPNPHNASCSRPLKQQRTE